MAELKLYMGQKPVRVSASTLFAVVKSIIAAGKEDDFLQESQKTNIGLEASPEVVNFVKNYLFNKQLDKNNPAMAHIVSPEDDAPSCF